MIVTFGSLEFVGDGSPATYTLASLGGWFGGVEMRHEMTSRPNAHGDFDAPVYKSGRIITLSGLILASDVASYEAAVDALETITQGSSASTLTVAQASGTYTILCRRHGSLEIDPVVYGHQARYQFHLWARNPDKELVP